VSAQGEPEYLSFEEALQQMAEQIVNAQSPPAAGAEPEPFIPTARFTTSVSAFDDDWLASLYGSIQITEKITLTTELDSNGYLGLGAGYSFFFKRSYIEPYLSYGRSDLLDLYDAGMFGAYILSPKWTAFGFTTHQWRDTTFLPLLAPKLFNQTEWITTLGVNYDFAEWGDVDLTVNHYRLLSGNRGINEVANDNITSLSVGLNSSLEPVEPFVRFTVGEHRVRPGDPVLTESSIEFGIRLATN